MANLCLFCLGPHDSINVLSYLDGKTKLNKVLGKIAGFEVGWYLFPFAIDLFCLKHSLFQYPNGVELPNNVCEACFDKARDIYTFQMVCQISLNWLVTSTTAPPAPSPKPVINKVEAISSQTKDEDGRIKPAEVTAPVATTPNDEYKELEVVEPPEADNFEEFIDNEFVPESAVEAEYNDAEEDLSVNVKSEKKKSPRSAKRSSRKKSAGAVSKPRSPRLRKQGISANNSLAKRNFGCHECDEYFETHKKLIVHNKEVHEMELTDGKIYYCINCMRKFESADSLKSHEGECKDNAALNKPFSCGICLQRFAYQTEVKQHQKEEHEAQKRFPCTVCGQKFTRKSQITMHMRSHTNERPYDCSVCHAAFSKRTNMVRHMMKHTAKDSGDLPYCCSVCDKSFRWETSLKVHLNTHSKVRLFKCEYCEKDYSSISGLRKHALVHHDEAM